ncbi:GHMP family kinase ATP-binding protein [Candidatus Ponderosibacter sp. Uisw_141_02]|uniref:GHMP family kinase ATP-binding protein n=1 Tax=Candidatus Ponderosibacter sp. Uisw_141_02 TaxID=3231000 RepID=UPI003D57DC85
MIICRTPMRISFIGGGSDIPAFYEKFGGTVVSTAIDKFMYIAMKPKFDDRIRAAYSITEEVDCIDHLQHPLIKAALSEMRVFKGVELSSMADVPKGTGLGSSSAFTVCLLHSLHVYSKRPLSSEELAQMACKIEIDICKSPIGKQDQYAAAYGGLNQITFHQGGAVSVNPLLVSNKVKKRLARHMMLFYTGISRNSADILSHQEKALSRGKTATQLVLKIRELVNPFIELLSNENFQGIGELLHESWMLKKQLTSCTSNALTDEMYQKAISSGAWGGKLLGAGGGGFLLLIAPPDKQQEICVSLQDFNRLETDLHEGGSQLVYLS